MKTGYSLVLSDEAYYDILDACLWYESARDGLGKDFELCIEAEINSLLRNPLQYQVKYKEIRIAYIERFPYGIHFIIDKKLIRVIAVFHTSRDPENWEERL
jgi:plasmid stabilization system protein ParE